MGFLVSHSILIAFDHWFGRGLGIIFKSSLLRTTSLCNSFLVGLIPALIPNLFYEFHGDTCKSMRGGEGRGGAVVVIRGVS